MLGTGDASQFGCMFVLLITVTGCTTNFYLFFSRKCYVLPFSLKNDLTQKFAKSVGFFVFL